jgi:pyruvate dehydrogenase E1 component alpha subunit
MNLAVIWKLPVIFLCENNGWASTTSHRYACSVPDVATRASGYGLQGVVVDGMDAIAVYDALRTAVGVARSGGGPALLEAKVVRWQGHYEGDPQGYRDKAEIVDGKARDPILRLGVALVAAGHIRDADVSALRQAAQDETDRAVAFGESSPWPATEDALEDLFARPV